MKTDCQWRMLPHEFPPQKTVLRCSRQWHIDSFWERIDRAIRERLRMVKDDYPLLAAFSPRSRRSAATTPSDATPAARKNASL